MDERTREQALDSLRHLMQPLGAALEDPAVHEIMINGPASIWVERDGTLQRLPLQLAPAVLRSLILVLARVGGRDPGADGAVVETRVPGWRVTAALSPLGGPVDLLCLRRQGRRGPGLAQLRAQGTLTGAQCEVLCRAVAERAGILVAGTTSSGKTTLLNALLAQVDPMERVISIEDTRELEPGLPHWLALEADGTGGGGLRELLRLALRLRPDRVVVGEVRGAEAFDLLQAAWTGHGGAMATVHAGSCAQALGRLETLVLTAGLGWPLEAIRAQIGDSFRYVLVLARVQGRRSLRQLAGVSGWDARRGRYRWSLLDAGR